MALVLDFSGGVLLLFGLVLMAMPYIAAGTVTLPTPMRRAAQFFMVLGFVVMILGGWLVSI